MKFLVPITLAFAGFSCASGPKCQNSRQSETIFLNAKSCEARIRSVQIATKMDLPRSFKDLDLATWKLDWSESRLVEGRIVTGHFTLEPVKAGVQ